jgi:hypothetical protein
MDPRVNFPKFTHSSGIQKASLLNSTGHVGTLLPCRPCMQTSIAGHASCKTYPSYFLYLLYFPFYFIFFSIDFHLGFFLFLIPFTYFVIPFRLLLVYFLYFYFFLIFISLSSNWYAYIFSCEITCSLVNLFHIFLFICMLCVLKLSVNKNTLSSIVLDHFVYFVD